MDLLCLIAVPITKVAVFSDRPYFQIISAMAYSWVVVGVIFSDGSMAVSADAQAVIRAKRLYRLALGAKAIVGAGLIALGFFVY